MRLSFEYGTDMMEATLPDTADVFVPGETVADPPCIPQERIVQETLNSLRNPLGMPPLAELAFPGAKCVIIFPDRVKGGEQPTSHRKVCIPLILSELFSAGVRKEDVLLICSNGLHSKNTEQQIRGILGDTLFEEYWPTGQIINHDSEDYEHLVDLGTTERGDPVYINKYVFDADVAVLVGHTQGNPYGGYSGGYKHCATGINHWTSIASHHVPKVMHLPDFVPVSCASTMRSKFDEIGKHMEACMGKKFFCCDAVLDTCSRQIEINSGWAEVLQPKSWIMADQRTYIPWATKKYDIMVFGMPRFFHYGDGMGTNPIMFMQAISAQVIRHKRVMSDRCVIICSSVCDGDYSEKLWPYTREMMQLYQNKNTLPELNEYGETFARNQQYIDQYRFHNAFHPFHGFSMISCGHIAEMNTSAIYIVGAKEPGVARSMGLKTSATFEEALADAMKKHVCSNPNILALPRTFKTAAVHLCMKEAPETQP